MKVKVSHALRRVHGAGRTGWVAVWLMMVVAGQARAGSHYEEQAQERFRLASSLFQAGRYEAATEEYRRFVKKFGDSLWGPEAELMVGESLFRQDPASKKALEVFQEVAGSGRAQSSGLAESAALRAAEVLFNQGRPEDALEAFLRVQRSFPGGALFGEAALGEAGCRLALGRWEEARAVLARLEGQVRAYARDGRYRYLRGVAAYQVAKDSEAITHLLEAPADGPGLFYLGRAYIRAGQPLLGVEKLKRLLQDFVDSEFAEEAEFLLGEAFLVARDYPSAIVSYEKFLRQHPRTALRPAAVFKTAVCRFLLEDHLQARSGFQSVLQEAPQSEFAAPALYLIGESFLKQDRYRDAAFAFTDLMQTYPRHELAPLGSLRLGWCQLKQDQPAPAVATLREMQQRFPDHALVPAALLLLGDALSRQEKHGAAALAYQAAQDRARGEELGEAALALMCRAYYRNRDDDALVSAYHYLLNRLPASQSPWRAATLLYIAEGYLRQGLFSEALALQRQVLSVYPASPLVPHAMDGAAWSLFSQGEEPAAQKMREALSDYGRRWGLTGEVFLRNPLETGNALFNQKKYLEALPYFAKFSADNPAHALAAEARYREALCYYRLEYYGQAIAAWEALEQAFPESPVAVRAAWQVADTYFRARKYDVAIATYRRILDRYAKEEEERAAVELRIAQAHFNAKALTSAVPAFDHVIRTYPLTKQAEEALEFLAALLEDPEARELSAQTLEAIGRDLGHSALAVEARFRMGAHLYERKDYAGAARVLEEVIADLVAGNRLAESQFFLAESYYQLQRYDEAANAYGRFLTNFPTEARAGLAHFRRASAAFRAEHYAAAAADFLALAERDPRSEYLSAALYNAGLAYKRAEQWEPAVAALSLYRNKFPDKANTDGVSEELAGVYEAQRNYPAAIAVLEQLHQGLRPQEEKWLDVMVRIGEDQLAGGEAARAVTAWQGAARSPLKTHASRLTALARVGEVLERLGRFQEAMAAYQELVASSPRAEWAGAARARLEAIRARQEPGRNEARP